jgi:hypothetical protein
MKSLIEIFEETLKVENEFLKPKDASSKEINLTKVEEILTSLDKIEVKGIIVSVKFWSEHFEEIHFLMIGADQEILKEQSSEIKTSKSLMFTYRGKPVYSEAHLPLQEFSIKFKNVKQLTSSILLLDSAVLA